MHKIILIDDHQLFRIAIANILSQSERLSIAGDFSTCEAAYPNELKMKPDAYIVDLELVEDSSFDFIKRMKSSYPHIKMIILSMHKAEFYLMKALNLGVDGYIHKNAEPEELIEGVEKVMQNEKFYSKEISEILLTKVYAKVDHIGDTPDLSVREKEIIKYISEGYSSKEIAGKLFLSFRTIEAHRARILDKLGLRNTADLVRLAVKEKII